VVRWHGAQQNQDEPAHSGGTTDGRFADMAEGFEVGHARGELDEQTRHALVAAQLRGEEKARGRDPEAVIAAVAEEIRALGLEPDREELERRYAAIDPDLPLTRDTEDEATDPPSEA
jgi:hypothetical protein